MPDNFETLIVADVMNSWPETVPVFISHRMACPGCVMAPFMTVTEAALEYGPVSYTHLTLPTILRV